MTRFAPLVAVISVVGACSSTSPPPSTPISEAGLHDAAEQPEAAACPSEGTAMVSGTFNGGQTFVPKDAVTTVGAANQITMTSFAGVCGAGSSMKASGRTLLLDFLGNAIQPGSVQVGSALNVKYSNYDAMCQAPAYAATGGSVTVTQVDNCAVTGTFDLLFPTERVTGSFSAAYCNGALGTTCVP